MNSAWIFFRRYWHALFKGIWLLKIIKTKIMTFLIKNWGSKLIRFFSQSIRWSLRNFNAIIFCIFIKWKLIKVFLFIYLRITFMLLLKRLLFTINYIFLLYFCWRWINICEFNLFCFDYLFYLLKIRDYMLLYFLFIFVFAENFISSFLFIETWWKHLLIIVILKLANPKNYL